MTAPSRDSPTLGTLHERATTLWPDDPAILVGETGERITYAEFDARVARAGNALAALGVGRGDRVGLFFPNEPAYLSLFFGATRLGAVPVPLNVESPTETLAYVLDDSDAGTVVASGSGDCPERAAAAAARTPGTVTLAIDDPEPSVEYEGPTESYAATVASADDELEPREVDGDEPAFQPYTSGSTGRPKGVVVDHEGAVWNANVIRKVHYFDENERGLVAAPLYHKNAMAGAVKPLLLAGGSVVVMNGFEPDAVLAAVEEYDVTYLTGVPAMYKLLLDSDALPETDVSSVDWAMCGSDNVPASLHEEFRDAFDASMLESYGLTEGGPVVSASPRWGARKVGSAGLALPDVETRVVDPDTGAELPPGEPGELIVSSPGVATYHDRPEKVAEDFEYRDGRRFLHTDDVVRIDEQGYHYVVGRLDDMLIVGGENVYPSEVEELLERHDAVEDSAVVAAPHAVKGEAPVAFVVQAEDGSATAEDLKQFFIDVGPAYAHPRRVFFREDLPLTGTGKVDREQLEAAARESIDGKL